MKANCRAYTCKMHPTHEEIPGKDYHRQTDEYLERQREFVKWEDDDEMPKFEYSPLREVDCYARSGAAIHKKNEGKDYVNEDGEVLCFTKCEYYEKCEGCAACGFVAGIMEKFGG